MTDVRLTMPNFPAFMVARKGRTARPGSTLPRMRYLTLDEAATQAKAEAAADPGKVIIVFQEVLRAKAEPSSTIPAAAPLHGVRESRATIPQVARLERRCVMDCAPWASFLNETKGGGEERALALRRVLLMAYEEEAEAVI